MSEISYIPDQSAVQVHSLLRRSLAVLDNAHQCAVLWFGEVMKRDLYRDMGCSSINQYATRELGFSKSKAGDFIRLARQLDKSPAVREAVASGDLGYTKAGKSYRWPHLKPRTPGSKLQRGLAKSWSTK